MTRLIHEIRLRLLCWSLNRRVRKFRMKLQRIVDEKARSFEVEQYRRRRAAALKHTRGELV